MLFTGYYIASEYLTNGQCQFTLGSLITASPAFSFLQPAGVKSTEFLSTAIDSFSDYLGFSDCSGGGENVRITSLSSLPVATVFATPTASDQSSLTPVPTGSRNSTQSSSTRTNTPSQNSTQSVPTHSSESYDEKAKIATGVAIPVASLGLVLLAFVVYRRRKTRKTLKEQDASSQRQESPREDTQPYLQQKAELEAEEKRKYELEARERRLEMGNEGERYELPVEGEGRMIRARQELRGEEHSTELEVPR